MKREKDFPSRVIQPQIAEKASENRHTIFVVDEGSSGERLDRFISACLTGDETPSRSTIGKWIVQGLVLVDGSAVGKCGHSLRAGNQVSVTMPEIVPRELIAEADIPFTVVFEDEDLLVINKPAGVVVHPGAGKSSGTLVNGIMHYLGPEVLSRLDMGQEQLRPGIVHRLDKDTSGLMIVAKNDFTLKQLQKQFLPPRQIERRYLALVDRLPKEYSLDWNIISRPMARHTVDRTKMAVIKSGDKTGGREAITRWKVEQKIGQGALLEVALETGRTHQIRVHLASIGCPIVGDSVYGYSPATWAKQFTAAIRDFGHQALHAFSLSFIHPRNSERLSFSVRMPEDMELLVERFSCGI
ncbi:MAG: RluA family pseudouridine synthase [bacterium]|nr:RluA family pseudouridine synthase [bacterium]